MSSVRSGDCGLNLDIPHFYVPMAYAVDMDRTVSKVSPAVERFILASQKFGVNAKSVRAAEKLRDSDGGSLSVLSLLPKLADPEFDKFFQDFISLNNLGMAYEDSSSFLDNLEQSGAPWMILTYGVDPLWQAIKAAVFDYRQKYLQIMPNSLKGAHIESWRGPQGTYDFVGLDNDGRPMAAYHSQSVTLVDDKATSHLNLPTDCKGALLRRPEEEVLSRQKLKDGEQLPINVATVQSLNEIAVEHFYPKPASCPGSLIKSKSAPSLTFRPANISPFNPGVIISGKTAFSALRSQFEKLQSDI